MNITEAEMDRAARDAAEVLFIDWSEDEGIGSSDISVATRLAFIKLGLNMLDFDREEVIAMRHRVSNHISKIFQRKNEW